MKREELMINDIVFDYANSPVKVCAVGQDIVVKNSFGVGSLEPNELRPIPLTEEILVKNGFKHSMPHNDWTNADCNFFLYEGGNGFRVQNTDIKLDYVHQFQHALRLCGIEKEIEL